MGIVGVLGSLGGSWVVVGGVISPLICMISTVTLLITLLISSHEPPSSVLDPQMLRHTIAVSFT